MRDKNKFDVIIVGGSYSGLSAAMSLGRSIRTVLIIDGGKPCNAQTPHSHNFITLDGQTPKKISVIAKDQVEKYDTIKFHAGLAVSGTQTQDGFTIKTQSADVFSARKLILTTGLKDIMPELKGFSECWGISILHCPYCHGYEVRNEKTGILAQGEAAFEFMKLIQHWTKELTLFTSRKSTLSDEQTHQAKKHNIEIIETEIDGFEHVGGYIQNVLLRDTSKISVRATYARAKFTQHSDLPVNLGCEMTEQGLLKVDMFQKTTVARIYACGDNSSLVRSVSVSVSTGSIAGALVNKEIIEDQ